jgi:hypothetical protein
MIKKYAWYAYIEHVKFNNWLITYWLIPLLLMVSLIKCSFWGGKYCMILTSGEAEVNIIFFWSISAPYLPPQESIIVLYISLKGKNYYIFST